MQDGRQAVPRELARTLGFTEGPLWSARHGLLVAGLSRGVIHQVDIDTGASHRFAVPGGRPNGLAEDDAGRVWVAQAGAEEPGHAPGPGIQCVTDGTVTMTLGTGFHAPNDLVIGPDRRLWFTDPAGSPFQDTPPGRIWAYDIAPDRLSLVAEGARFPNGLAFSPRDGALYVAETATARILRYEQTRNGAAAPTPFATLPAGQPDGITFDQRGNLYVAGLRADAVFVFAPDGALIDRIAFEPGCLPTNLCFGGPDLCTLFVTVAKGGRVFAVTPPLR